MISDKTRREIFRHLRNAAEIQRQVRNCKIEGSVYDMESDIAIMSCYNLISFTQEDVLKRRLER